MWTDYTATTSVAAFLFCVIVHAVATNVSGRIPTRRIFRIDVNVMFPHRIVIRRNIETRNVTTRFGLIRH